MVQEQFADIMHQYERLVFTICYQLTRDTQVAEDLTQETFLSVYNHRDAWPVDYLKPWIARIATNKAKDHLKSAYNRRVYLDAGEAGLEVVAQDPLPEDLLESEEARALLREYIDALKEPYLQVSILYFYEDLKTEEIAERLDRPKKTVETQLYRAKQKLKVLLEKEAEKNGAIL